MKSIKNLKQFAIYLKQASILKYIFPSLNNVYYLEGGQHHNETVFEHCTDTCSFISSKYPELKIAGLLHDVGKKKFEMKDDKMTFPKHEVHSKEFAEKDLKKLKFSNDFIEKVCNIIKFHMWIIMPTSKDKAIRKWLIALRKDNVNYKDMLRLRIADRKANRKKEPKPLEYWKILLKKIKDVQNYIPAFCVKDLKIDGHDLIRLLNLKRGNKIVGDVLKVLFQMVVNDEVENEREALLNCVKEKL